MSTPNGATAINAGSDSDEDVNPNSDWTDLSLLITGIMNRLDDAWPGLQSIDRLTDRGAADVDAILARSGGAAGPATISLTDSEECAIDIALMLIDNEIERFVIVLGEAAAHLELRTQRDALAELQARWHRANCIAKQGQLHTANCGWCQDVRNDRNQTLTRGQDPSGRARATGRRRS